MKTVNLQLEEGEEARPIEGYEWYLVTSFGGIFSLKSGKFLKGSMAPHGYLTVTLCDGHSQKTHYIHRLVAQAFLPNYSEDLDVNHLDECKRNNNIFNLKMCNRQENLNYGTRNARVAEKLSKQVLCLTNGVIYPSIAEASRQLNLHSGNISLCCHGKRKQTGGYSFKFV